jgi:ferritin-like metal-binding protein YciE
MSPFIACLRSACGKDTGRRRGTPRPAEPVQSLANSRDAENQGAAVAFATFDGNRVLSRLCKGDCNVTSTTSNSNDKAQKTLTDYLGDLVNIENHIEAALDGQKNETKDDPTAGPMVQRFHDMVRSQRDQMRQLQKQRGETAGKPITEAVSTLLGKAAGAIDMVRTEGVSKSLRDDYVAFNWAAISYEMMYTTATALGDTQLADISRQHLTNYAQAVQEINHALPEVVMRELEKDDHNVQSNAAQQTVTMVDRAWTSTAKAA